MNTKKLVIKVENLVKSYNSLKAVKGISFVVYQNEVFGLLGPNGAGKTTTLEIIEGLRQADKGQISILDLDVHKDLKRIKPQIGVQLQASAFFDDLTVYETLDLFASFYPHNQEDRALKEKRIKQIIIDFDLAEKEKAYTQKLSGGQKQRLAIGVAMVNDPEIIFLDEPTTGLDPQARHHTWEIVKKLQERGKTIVLTTHYMEEAEILCDRVAIMNEGQIISEGTPQKLISDLLEKGFKKEKERQLADLEDVFLNLTGKKLRE